MSILSPGQVAKVDTSSRLSVPADVLSEIGWYKKTMEVKAELVQRGLVRIYLPEHIEKMD